MKILLLIIFLIPVITIGKSDFIQNRYSLYVIASNPHLDNISRAESYVQLCDLYAQFKPDSVLDVCEIGFTFIREARSKNNSQTKLIDLESQILQTASTAFYNSGELNKSISLLYRALSIKEQLIDQKSQIYILSKIGNVQLELKDIPNSRKTFIEVLSIQSKIKDNDGILKTYNTLGYIEQIENNDSLALNWYQKSLALQTTLNLKTGIAQSHINIGFIYQRSTQYDEAINEYDQALIIYDSLNLTKEKIPALNNLANCYYERREYRKGHRIAQQALEIAELNNAVSELIYLNKTISRIKAIQRYDRQSHSYYKRYAYLKDSVLQNNYKELQQQQIKNNVQQQLQLKEIELSRKSSIAKLKNKNEQLLSTERADHSSSYNTLLIIGSLLLLVLFYLLRRQIRLRKEQEEVVRKQKVQLEIKTLRSKINPNFLFKGLNSLKKYIIENNAQIAGKHLTKFATLVRTVLDHSSKDSISLSDEISCLSLYAELEKIRFSGHFDLEINTISGLGKYKVPPLFLHPFIENSIWHGILNKKGSSGSIKINILEIAEGIKIEIIDDGVGREKVKEILEENIFREVSLGLIEEQERLTTLNEQVDFRHTIYYADLYNRENESVGTKVIITIPKR
ncbi:MAG: tetratricopeptide repeat protein [Crocinitomix sp.]|nr:tetratricopeptide repeat protein [Crocinitomix sp.]